jgi:GAF domain-containing protein
MAENLFIPETKDRKEIYEAVIPQIEALISTESDLIANLANISAVLKEAFGFFWVGFYLTKGNQLVLGPFQGHWRVLVSTLTKGFVGIAIPQNRR